MTDIHLISSPSLSYENNTRTNFENDIPQYKDLSYIGICLKELYFQANFVTVNKQTNPHIVFIIKLHTGLSEVLTVAEGGEYSEDPIPTYIPHSEKQIFGEKQRTVIDKYDFGRTIKTIFTEALVLEVIFHPTRFEKVIDIINIFNYIFSRNRLEEFVYFYKILSQNKIGYKTRETLILFDLNFMNFLGLKKNDRIKFSNLQAQTVKDSTIRKFLQSFVNNQYYFFGVGPKFLSRGPPETTFRDHIGKYKLDLEINTPEKVIVNCESVDSQVYKSKLIRYLGLLNVVSSSNKLKNYQTYNTKSQLIHYQPIQPLFLSVKSENIQSIKISLQEENGKPLSLETAGPTLITLKTTQNPKMNCHRLVFSSSNDISGLQLHPNNKAGKFYHHLPKDIELKKHNLGVELVSLSISKKIYNITKPFSNINLSYEVKNPEKLSNSSSLMEMMISDPAINIISVEDSILPSIYIKSGNYRDLEEIIEENQDLFLSVGIKLNHYNNRLILINQSSNLTITLSIHNSLALMFGMTNQISNDKFQLPIEDKYVCPYLTKTQLLSPDYILVYADFIENSIVGGIEAPILKVVPSPAIDEDSPERVYYDFQGQNTIGICKDVLTDFCIELRDVTGKILEYDNSAYSEILLAFKEKVVI